MAERGYGGGRMGERGDATKAMQQELFPRLKECQGKYSFYLKKAGRSLELKFVSSGFVP